MKISKMPTTFALKAIEGYKNHPSVKTRSKNIKKLFYFQKKNSKQKESLSEYCYINKNHKRELWCDKNENFIFVIINNNITSSFAPTSPKTSSNQFIDLSVFSPINQRCMEDFYIPLVLVSRKDFKVSMQVSQRI